MKNDLNTDLLKADGFTDAEIASIRQYLEAAPLGYEKANAYVLHCGKEDAERIGQASRKLCASTIADGQHRFRGIEFRASKN